MKSLLKSLVLVSTLAIVTGSEGRTTFEPDQFHRQLESTRIDILGAQLLRARLEHLGLENAMVSPVSLFYALAMLREGAEGYTAELLDSLLLEESATDVRAVAEPLSRVLQHRADGQVGEFSLVNSVWASNGPDNKQPFYFSSDFSKAVQQSYNAEIQNADFLRPGAAAMVNQWVEKTTQGLITDVIDDITLSELSWLIINAAYFEGAWATQFRRLNADPEFEFKNLDGSSTQLSYIAGRQKSRVIDHPDGSVGFSIPFKGGKYAMVIYIPPQTESDVAAWIQNAGVNQLNSVSHKVLSTEATVYDYYLRMPPFSYADRIKVDTESPISVDMGLQKLFGEHTNYVPMVDVARSSARARRTTLSFIQQDTRIDLDENGAKAAAITVLAGLPKITSAPPTFPKRNIDVDRPFLWAIVERESKTPLFTGVVVTPSIQ